MRSLKFLASLTLLFFVTACASKPEQPASTQPGTAAPDTSASAPAPGTSARTAPSGAKAVPGAPATVAAPTSVPAGTVLTVRLGQALGSKASHSGDEFMATLAEPVESGGNVLIPEGANARGVVEEAVPLGKFKGGARLKISLKEVTIGGKPYTVETSSVERSEKGKGKRTATLIGGGAGVGALIGGLAGGGKGAAIGALAGGGAGTAGAAYTGNKDIVLPAEMALSFKLLQPVEVKK